jgi:hypothetical protein
MQRKLSTIVSESENGQADVLIRPGKADSWFSLMQVWHQLRRLAAIKNG